MLLLQSHSCLNRASRRDHFTLEIMKLNHHISFTGGQGPFVLWIHPRLVFCVLFLFSECSQTYKHTTIPWLCEGSKPSGVWGSLARHTHREKGVGFLSIEPVSEFQHTGLPALAHLSMQALESRMNILHGIKMKSLRTKDTHCQQPPRWSYRASPEHSAAIQLNAFSPPMGRPSLGLDS